MTQGEKKYKWSCNLKNLTLSIETNYYVNIFLIDNRLATQKTQHFSLYKVLHSKLNLCR